MSTFVITVATAAARLQTDSNVIHQWIREGRIPIVDTADGIMIPLEPFEQICREIEAWAASEESDKEGVTKLTPQDMEQFWQERRSP